MKILKLCIVVLVALSGYARAETRPFDIDAFLALQRVSEVAVSPDERFVAYSVRTNDLEEDKRGTRVWMVDVASGEAVPMTSADSSASSPQWSPDNRYLAVMSDRKDETTQVWLLNRMGGDAMQLTDVKQGVSGYRWSPDGSRMLLSITDARPADLDEEELPNPRPWEIDRLQFKQDYVGYLDRYRTHIYVFDIESKELRQVTFGDYDDASPRWSPDGSRIAFVSNRTEEPDSNYNTDIWIVDADAEDPQPVQVTTSPAGDDSPAWSPDGRKIAYRSNDPDIQAIYALPYLAVVDVRSKAVTTFDDLNEIQVFEPRIANGGTSIVTIAEQRGEQKLVSVDVDSGRVADLIDGDNIVSEFDLADSGEVYARVSNPATPAELFRLSDGKLSQLTNVNTEVMQQVTLGDMRKFSYKAPDGFELESFVVFPPDYRKGQEYPGLLRVHGGPVSQYDYSFHAEAQLIAAQGYVVVMPNPRGGSGYGQDFTLAIWQDWGGIDYDDVVASMDHAIDEGWVDPDRTGVFGWSYGGMMTNHVITKTGRFKAAITGASATLYAANYGHDQYQRWWEQELGLPWQAKNRETWDNITPFYRLDNVTTPTLVVCGEHDWNVPVQNSEQLYAGLKRLGVPTELIVYPGQFHGISVPSYQRHMYERYVDWFATYIPE